MIRIEGIVVQEGLSIGPVRVLRRDSANRLRLPGRGRHAERFRFEAARDRAVVELRRLRARVASHLGDNESFIFLAQSMMLEDEGYLKSIYHYIDQDNTAEYAVEAAGRELVALFASLDSSYLRARAADARDLSRRLEGILSERRDWLHLRQNAVILAAEDLTPSDTTLPDDGKLLGLVSHHGSTESHTAILARAIGIPALTGIAVRPEWDGHIGILDGENGHLIIDPDPSALQAVQPRIRRVLDNFARGNPRRFRPVRGGEVKLSAMVANAWEANDAYDNGADGIGLYRTEFLFEDRELPPSEEEQFVEYQRTVYAMRGRSVTIRLLDWERCQNLRFRPGYRERGQILRTQIRAILRSAAHGPAEVSAALPGPDSALELRAVRQILRQCRTELEGAGIPCRPVQLGAAIRTPKAAFHADHLAAEADFLILDTHSLRHSTMEHGTGAADYPTTLWMIQRSVRAGKRHNRPVRVCGDLERYPYGIQAFLNQGVEELSVPSKSLIPIRRLIRKLDEAAPHPKQAGNRFSGESGTAG